MSRQFFVVFVPLVVVRNYLVNAPGPDEALAAIGRAPKEWFTKCMHSERIVGMFETFEGVPMKATELTQLADEDREPDPDLGVLS